MQDIPERLKSAPATLGPQIIGLLERGKLPQMVDWLDPVMLAQIGMRTIVSGTLGEYADQRLMQAATDRVTEADLRRRYNYSARLDGAVPDEFWIDYISDLGDGFEATYAMAYTMAPDLLRVEGSSEALTAGHILIMGGDQAYPQSSPQEYKDRLINPYDWAFMTDDPQRKLFAIPGNHDWYDGLGAFDTLFCSVRNLISKNKGNQIGGWRCHQHRSYWALRLPHNWWIWGADIQLGGVFDKPQRDYFHIMSEEAKEGHKIIICIAEPSWLHEQYDNLLDITYLAQKHGAKVYAVLAGDLHHYSRYCTKADNSGKLPLNTQFITCGGGGAFAHATHKLKNVVPLRWPEVVREKTRARSAAAGEEAKEQELWPDRKPRTVMPDLKAMGQNVTAAMQAKTHALALMDVLEDPPTKKSKPSKDVPQKPSDIYDLEAHAIYPSKNTSRLLSLKNILVPVHNWGFALFVGFVYFLFAWVFLTTDNALHPATQSLWSKELEGLWIANNAAYSNAQRLKERADVLANKPGTDPVELDNAKREAEHAQSAYEGINKYFDAIERRNVRAVKGERLPVPLTMLQSTDVGHLDEYNKYSLGKMLTDILDPQRTLSAALANPAYFFMLLGLLFGLIFYADVSWKAWYGLGTVAKIIIGGIHCVLHVAALLFVCALVTSLTIEATFQTRWVEDLHPDWPAWFKSVFNAMWDKGLVAYNLVEPLIVLFYTLSFFLLGGLLGALIFGLYWALMSTLFARHTDDAFGALGIRHYKHFLRMKFEKDRLTIYPIAVDKIPGRRGWRSARARDPWRAHNPQIVPKQDLAPRLIDGPIVIRAE
jgi:hypothetical protein